MAEILGTGYASSHPHKNHLTFVYEKQLNNKDLCVSSICSNLHSKYTFYVSHHQVPLDPYNRQKRETQKGRICVLQLQC